MYLSISVAAGFLGVCTKTLRRWHAMGLFEPDFRTPGGHRRYSLSRLEAFCKREMKHDEKSHGKMHDEGVKGNVVKVAAIYARVSARKQLDDLQRQLSFLERYVQDAGFKKVMVYKDVASGINDSRNGMKKLLRDAFHRRFQALFITHHDRLARFGTNLIRQVLDLLQISMHVVGIALDDSAVSETQDSPETRLVNDVLAILTSYSG